MKKVLLIVFVLGCFFVCYQITSDEEIIEEEKIDNRLFSDYYDMAEEVVSSLTIEQRVNELLLVRYDETLRSINVGGFIFYAKDFANKTKDEVLEMTNITSSIPLLIAVDEEGGKVIRVSSNSNLVSSPFLSSSELYQQGGLDLIYEDTINKSNVLASLGINLNLAPVVDVATDESAYIYERTLKEDAFITSEYAKVVIEASKEGSVSYTLKHFPGYGNNSDTHINEAIDERSYEEIMTNDIKPFVSGIEAGAESVLVSHNTITSIDGYNPASLSAKVIAVLRNDLGFTGVIITDDLDMGATSNIENKYTKALLAGNTMLIVSDYETAYNEIMNSLNDGSLSEDLIYENATLIIAWKYYKGMIGY